MNAKKSLIILLMSIFLISFISAQNLEIKLEKNVFQQGEDIKYTVQLLDDNNNPINDKVSIKLVDATEINVQEDTVQSNTLNVRNLGENANFGYWKITAKYKDKEVTRIFSIESNEQVQLEIINDELKITNIGNIFYARTIQIVIGEKVETKDVRLNVGQSTSLKLVAPDGNYNIEVTDGKNKISKENVFLTGNAVAILSEDEQGSVPITGVNKASEDKTQTLKDAIKHSKVTLVFIFAIFGLFILIVVQRLKEAKSR